MDKIKRIFNNRNFIMLLSLFLGIAWEDGAYLGKDLMLPLLALIMTISTTTISSDVFRSFTSMFRPALAGFFVSYIFHGGLLLLLNELTIKNDSFWTGFVLLSAVPPAVAVLPFAIFLKGDTSFVLFGSIGAYLGALFTTPLILILFLGSGFINPFKVFLILIELIIAPLILSRILIKTGVSKKIEPLKGMIVNWSFFLVVYIVTGLNRNVILHRPLELVPVLILSILSTFTFGWIIELVSKRLFKIKDSITKSLILLGTYKNYGLAGGLALVFFDTEAAVPATVASTVSIVYIIYLQMKVRRNLSKSN
ncbi:MAG: hypothetical protein N2745_00525 [Syntrophorhabdaceae bacterium]|nr:hypothetical protein [Syntrophorhabdaceae bacterium]